MGVHAVGEKDVRTSLAAYAEEEPHMPSWRIHRVCVSKWPRARHTKHDTNHLTETSSSLSDTEPTRHLNQTAAELHNR